MPGNLVVINGSEGFTWYVGDSKMDELIRFLHEIGFQEQPKAPIKEGMMEPIEKELWKIWHEAKTTVSEISHLDFCISEYKHSGKTKIWGFVHIAEAMQWHSIKELRNIISNVKQSRDKEKILFKNFRGILDEKINNVVADPMLEGRGDNLG